MSSEVPSARQRAGRGGRWRLPPPSVPWGGAGMRRPKMESVWARAQEARGMGTGWLWWPSHSLAPLCLRDGGAVCLRVIPPRPCPCVPHPASTALCPGAGHWAQEAATCVCSLPTILAGSLSPGKQATTQHAHHPSQARVLLRALAGGEAWAVTPSFPVDSPSHRALGQVAM